MTIWLHSFRRDDAHLSDPVPLVKNVMQVNTIWVPAIASRAQLSPTVAERQLIEDPCFNIAAAALILRTYLQQTGGALMPAIGDYNSHTLILNESYALQVEMAALRLCGH